MIQNAKISIITPSFNSEAYIEKCIQSLISQEYKNFEHIIIDGGSTDGTVDIIKKYEKVYPLKWISESDKGMYNALNKGFDMAQGDVFAWINADDYYFPWTLHVVAKAFERKDIEWLSGIPSNTRVLGNCEVIYQLSNLPIAYNSKLIKKGYYNGKVLPFVQQESCFWSSKLWILAGEKLNDDLQYAADYYLWRGFAKYTDLYTIHCNLASFTIHQNQKTSDMVNYYKELQCKNNRSLSVLLTCFTQIYSLILYRKKVINLIELFNKE